MTRSSGVRRLRWPTAAIPANAGWVLSLGFNPTDLKPAGRGAWEAGAGQRRRRGMTNLELPLRLAELERSTRRWRAAAVLMAAACFAVVSFGQAQPDDPARDETRAEGRRLVSLAVVPSESGGETLYRLWSDGNIERKRTPIFDFRGGDKWELLRRP
jgi:hypothetical protein